MLEVTVIGHIGADAEVKESNGNRFIKFSVADTKRHTDEQGVVTEKTTWVDVIKNIGNESRLAEYLKKGAQVYVRGNLSTNIYQTRSGSVNSGIKCNAKEVTLLSPSSSSSQPNAVPNGQQFPAQQTQQQYQPTQGLYPAQPTYPQPQRNPAPQGTPSYPQGGYYKK